MKKKGLTGAIALLCAAQILNAVPAKPGKFLKIQPDGSTITLQRHGDEFLHWTTDENGTVVDRNEKGLYVPSTAPVRENLGGRSAAAASAAAIRARRSAAPALAPGQVRTCHFPVVLVQFSDVKFTSSTANADFSRLLNEEGYSDNGATGSVHDYYWENSMGTFNAVFDVYGPYDYNGTCAANSDEDDAAVILWSAIQGHDADVDWSQYDNDNDGYVDMVFLYYAGWNEAEGEDNTIWPHKFEFGYAGVGTTTLDGKKFSVYACTSERKGTSYSDGGMCGIGTCAHEFSHTQGLPDFYDTNDSEYSVNGTAGGTYNYDIMCSGSYNNDSRTPPYFSAEERIMMGWLDGFATLPSEGTVTIPSVDHNFAFKLETTNTSGLGEYFIFECRSGAGWDAYLQPGLLVYHVDKSTKYSNSYTGSNGYSLGNLTGYALWSRSDYRQYINANGSHPCYYLIPADAQDNLDYSGSSRRIPFPGRGMVTQYTPKDWSGEEYGFHYNIAFNPNGTYEGDPCPVVTLEKGAVFRGISGMVTNTAGEPVEGASVSVYKPASIASHAPASGIQRISGRIPGNLMMTARTDQSGCYSFDLSSETGTTVDVEVAASGFITRYEPVTLSDGLETQNFVMRGIDEPVDYTLLKFEDFNSLYINGYGSAATTLCSIHFTEEELRPYIGRKVLYLSFAYTLGQSGSVSSVYGLADFGGERKMIKQVSSPVADDWNDLDVSDQDLYIPSGSDAYFGFALQNCTYGYPMLFTDDEPQEGGANYLIYSANSSEWRTDTDWNSLSNLGNMLVIVYLDDSTVIDYNSIANPSYGTYKVGDTFPLTLKEADGARKPGTAVRWFFDDEPVSGPSVVLKYPGYHVVEARFTTTEGKTKVVELELMVNP